MSPKKFTKRDSVAAAETELEKLSRRHLTELRQIWDAVGMDEDQREDRMKTVVHHVENLFAEMVDEERIMYEHVVETIKRYKDEIHEIASELHLEPIQFAKKGEYSLIDEEAALKNRLDGLAAEKHRRMQIFKVLHDDDAGICKRLDIAEYYIAPNCVPSEHQLTDLRQHVDQNRREIHLRMERLGDYKSKIIRLLEKLGLKPKTDVEKRLLSDPISELPLSNDFLSKLDSLHRGLQNQWEIYLESIRQRVNEVKEELVGWWDRCHVGDRHRSTFQHVGEEDFDEEALERYNNEIIYWKSYYEERQEVFDKMASWRRLWDEKMQYYEKDKDANRYLNRGGCLLQEEKERKKIEKQLPFVKSEIKSLVAKWNEDHPTQPILIENVSPVVYIETTEQEYADRIKREKDEKVALKKQQLENERLYGASPVAKGRQGSVKRPNTPSQSKVGNQSKLFLGRSTKIADRTAACKTYVHSSLAITRSPGQFLATPTVPNLPAVTAKHPSLASKPPPGLPKGAADNRKRKLETQPVVPFVQVNNGDATTSTASYNEFTQELRERGLDGQSSFIVIATPTPTKMSKK